MKPVRLHAPMLLLAATLAAPAHGVEIFSDGDFATATFGEVGDQDADIQRIEDGITGNAFLRVETLLGPPTNFIWATILLADAVWDTSLLGAIDAVGLSLEARAFAAAGQGQAVAILARNQATGDLYRGGSVLTFAPPDFTPLALSDIGEDGFLLFDDTAPGGVTPTQRPDFSAGVWEFGFAAGNSGSTGTSLDYDDVSLTVTEVPEPRTAALFGGAVAALAWRRRPGRRARNPALSFVPTSGSR